jgi:capsular polysaccharide transport system ATP-binding protein
MLDFDAVTDSPDLYGHRVPLLAKIDFHLPAGRYALLSETPEYHRPLIDLVAGLRPPQAGLVRRRGRMSWPVGRQGFVRGRASGHDLIELICSLYGLDAEAASEVVTTLVTRPDYLARPIERWPAYVRQEFAFAVALVPDFDIYVVDGPIPFEPGRFSRLWQALFEERLVGKSLILSTYRQNQMLDYCAKVLVYEQGQLTIRENLEACIERYPARPSREELGGGGAIGVDNGAGDLPF